MTGLHSDRPHRQPGWRVERQAGTGWEELAPAWTLPQALRVLSSRRGHLERVRIVDLVTGRVSVDVKPGDDWEYELWR